MNWNRYQKSSSTEPCFLSVYEWRASPAQPVVSDRADAEIPGTEQFSTQHSAFLWPGKNRPTLRFMGTSKPNTKQPHSKDRKCGTGPSLGLCAVGSVCWVSDPGLRRMGTADAASEAASEVRAQVG